MYVIARFIHCFPNFPVIVLLTVPLFPSPATNLFLAIHDNVSAFKFQKSVIDSADPDENTVRELVISGLVNQEKREMGIGKPALILMLRYKSFDQV